MPFLMPIRIYKTPVVTLIARPQFVEPAHMPVTWLGASGDGERLAEFAGRLCYMSQHNPAGRSNFDYLGHILESGHGSVLEHANYSLLIEGVSRSLTHELIRHRAGFAVSQLSQRFVDESDCAFVMPPAIIGDEELEEDFVYEMETAQRAYRDFSDRLFARYDDVADKTLRRKRAREAARCVLPNATETKLVFTGNVRALRNILEQRGSEHADQEINRLTRAIAEVLVAEAPNFFQDVVVTDTTVTTRYRKV